MDNGVFQCMFPSGADSNIECSQVLRNPSRGNVTESGPSCLPFWQEYTANPSKYAPNCNVRFINPGMEPATNASFSPASMTSTCTTAQYPKASSQGCTISAWTWNPKNGQAFFPGTFFLFYFILFYFIFI